MFRTENRISFLLESEQCFPDLKKIEMLKLKVNLFSEKHFLVFLCVC